MIASLRYPATVAAVLICLIGVPGAAPAGAQQHPNSTTATTRPIALPIAAAGALKVIAVHRDTGAIDTMSITGQAVTVTITSRTTFSEDGTPAAFADVTPGLFIAIGYAIEPNRPGAGSGAPAGLSSAAARPIGPAMRITILLPTVSGVVTGVSGPTLAVTGFDALPHTVVVATGTRIERAGQAIAAADISLGSVITGRGIDNPDGSLTARRISVQLPMLAGTITSLTANTIAITGDYGMTAAIVTTPSTVYRTAAGRPSPRAALAPGKRISAEGTLAAGGTLTALRIVLLGPPVRCLGIDQPAGVPMPTDPCYPPCPLPPGVNGSAGATPTIACIAPGAPTNAAQ